MIKLYEESELKRLTTSEIDRMKDDVVFIQISETKFERKKDPEYDRYYDAYLCEVMDRDKYEGRTKTGQLRKLERTFGDLPPEIVSLYRTPDQEG